MRKTALRNGPERLLWLKHSIGRPALMESMSGNFTLMVQAGPWDMKHEDSMMIIECMIKEHGSIKKVIDDNEDTPKKAHLFRESLNGISTNPISVIEMLPRHAI